LEGGASRSPERASRSTDVLAFEIAVWPPIHAGAIESDDLGKELLAIGFQGIWPNGADFERPEAAAAGFVAQVGVAVGGTDKDALARLNNFPAAVAWPVAFNAPRNEILEQCCLGAIHGVHFGDFNEPFSA
jgi:hypothetical protein